MSNTHVIEKEKRLSDSYLWQLQREYYHQKGIDAWGDTVPFFVTSNTVIATQYANIIFDYIQDWIANNPGSEIHPFYILELGAGSGQFSYYTLKIVSELITQMQRQDIQLRYIMSDFTENNLDYWKQHPSLKPFIENDTLDFTSYNLETNNEIHLQIAKTTLNKKTIKNPLIVIANYIFDTVSHDSFRIIDGQLHEALATLTTSHKDLDNNKPRPLSDINVSFIDNPIEWNDYYSEKEINFILRDYTQSLNNTSFLIPIASLNTIKNLAEISQNKFLMISSDKAKAFISELENNNRPGLAFHGSFSMTVNYDAIARYINEHGGDSFRPTARSGLKTCVFSLGADFNSLPNTKRSLDREIQNFMPADYFSHHQFMKKNKDSLDARTISTYLLLSKLDPYVFNQIAPRINNVINDADRLTQQQIKDIVKKIADMYYFIPSAHDTFFDVGLFYHTIEDYTQAIHFYNLSKRYFGDNFNTIYNLGLCYFYKKEKQFAVTLFKKSLQLEPDNKDAAEWKAYIENLINAE